MIIADQLKKRNRIEYILYMWQVEDIIRAYACDFDRIKTDYLCRFRFEDEAQRERTEQWYADLCNMMHSEGVMEGGHLQINKNILQNLTELHEQLLASANFPYYKEMYYNVLPYIVELRGKSRDKNEAELQTCLDALYGVMLLRLQKKSISPETEKAVKDITTLLGQLSDYYLKDQEEPLEF